MKYTSTILAALATTALAYKPAEEPVCSVVTVTKYGTPVWVPTPGVWDDAPAASTSTTKNPWEDVPAASTSTKDPWGDVPAASTSTHNTWEDVPAVSTSTKDPWGDVPEATTTTTKGHGGKPTTTDDKPKPTTTTDGKPKTTTTKTTTTTTTTSVPKPKATCPADNGKTVLAGGSCGCSFKVNCGVYTVPNKDLTKFWQRKEGEKIGTLAECNAICDANTKCTATLWVDDVNNGDYHLCFQTSDLPAPAGAGAAQISYKGSCSGKCTESYNSIGK